MTPIKLHYSERLVRSAAKAFWWRTTGWTYFAAFIIVLGSFCYGLWRGDRSWWVGLSGAISGFAAIGAIAVYIVHYRGMLTRFRRMRTPEAMIELGEERLRFSSDVGTTELEWSLITEVWLFPDFWLLFVSRAQFMTVPAADLDPEARNFILAKAKSHGAKVV